MFHKDVETGWYYLQSRYYNPEIGRFINADGLLGPSGVILGYNMYAYTLNNPVMMVDPSGYSPIQVVFAAIGGIAGWFFGDYVAKQLNLNGWKYWTVRTAVTVGGAALGWFAGGALTKIAERFLMSHPAILARMPKFVLKFLGITPPIS